MSILDIPGQSEYNIILRDALNEGAVPQLLEKYSQGSLKMSVDSPQGEVNLGVDYLKAVAKFFGYEAVGEYFFPESHLYA